MKRAPLTRKLGRFRKRAKPASKAQAYARSVAPDRNAWKESQEQRCWICRRHERELFPPERLDIHELLPKSAAPNRWWHRCNGALVCTSCHSEHGHAKSDVWWLARKLVFDPLNYCLKTYLEMKNPNAPHAIEQEEVEAEAAKTRGNA